MTDPQPRSRPRKPVDAGVFQPEIGSFWLHLAAGGKAARTVRTYTEAVQWFAAHLIPHTFRNRWEQVDGQDTQRWLVHLLAATATPMAATSIGRCNSSSDGSRRRSNSRTPMALWGARSMPGL